MLVQQVGTLLTVVPCTSSVAHTTYRNEESQLEKEGKIPKISIERYEKI